MIRRIALAILAVGLAGSALAQDRSVLRNACRDDYARLCAGTTPGGGRIAACFKEKQDQLTQGCRDALRQAAMRRGG